MFWDLNCLDKQLLLWCLFLASFSESCFSIPLFWLCNVFHLKSLQTAPLFIICFAIINFVRTVFNLGNKFQCVIPFCSISLEIKGVSKLYTNEKMLRLELTFNFYPLLKHIDVITTFIAPRCGWNCASSCACTSALPGQAFLVLTLCPDQEKHLSLECLATSTIWHF